MPLSEKARKYNRAYYLKRKPEYANPEYKNRVIQIRKKFYENNPWVKYYESARNRCRYPQYGYVQKGIKLQMVREDFKELWFRDKAWLLKRPSVDRINNDLNYTKSNCRFIEFTENMALRKACVTQGWDRYGQCVDCGTNNKKYTGLGRCENCYRKKRWREGKCN